MYCLFFIITNPIETLDKINALSNSAASIKRTTLNIKQMMADDEALVVDIDKGLVKNQNMLK